MKRNHIGYRVGECHHRAKLTDEQVKLMRAEYIEGKIGYGKLAKKYGCGESTARDICTYQTRWAV